MSQMFEYFWCGTFLRRTPTIIDHFSLQQNPQIYLELEEPGDVSFTLRRYGGDEEEGIIMFLYRLTGRSRLLKICDDNDTPVCVSPYEASTSVTLKATDLEARVPYVLLCCTETPNQDIRLRVVLKSKFAIIKDFFPFPPPVRRVVEGEWRNETAAGYGSTANPQFLLFVSKKTNLAIEIKRMDDEPSCGLCFFVCKGRDNKKKKRISDDDMLHESEFFFADSVKSELELENSSIPYIVMPFLEDEGVEDTFQIIVEGIEDVFDIEEIEETAAELIEDDCSSILAKYRSSKSKKKFLFERNPVPEIIRHCEKNGCVFVDTDFPANDTSLDTDPRTSSPEVVSDKVSEWSRPLDLFDNSELFVDGVSIDDLEQGALGNCWFCQALASASERPELISRLF